jgi:hypothetical protein
MQPVESSFMCGKKRVGQNKERHMWRPCPSVRPWPSIGDSTICRIFVKASIGVL